MNSDTNALIIPAASDPVAAHIGTLVTETQKWVNYAADRIERGKSLGKTYEALEQIALGLTEIEKHNQLNAAVLPGLREVNETLRRQRDELTLRLENIKATYDRQMHAAIDAYIRRMMDDSDAFDEAQIEQLVRLMMADDVEAVAEKARNTLEKQLRAASKITEELRAEGSQTRRGLRGDVRAGSVFPGRIRFPGGRSGVRR